MFTLSGRSLSKIVAPALVAALGLGAAIPAQAQDWRHNDRGDRGGSYHAPTRHADIRTDIVSLDRAIDRAASRRAISPREASGLRSQAKRLQRNYARFARDGLTRQEARSLQSGVTQIRHALRAERRDSNRRRG